MSDETTVPAENADVTPAPQVQTDVTEPATVEAGSAEVPAEPVIPQDEDASV